MTCNDTAFRQEMHNNSDTTKPTGTRTVCMTYKLIEADRVGLDTQQRASAEKVWEFLIDTTLVHGKIRELK